MGNSLGRISNPHVPRLGGQPSTGVRKVSYRGSLIARTNGPSGRVPQGFVRRVRCDPGDRLRPIVRASPGAALPPVDRGVRDLPRPRPVVADPTDDTATVVISINNHRPWTRKIPNAAVNRRKRRSRWRAYDWTETVARIAANPANETLRNTSRGPICPRNEASSVRYFAYAGRRLASEGRNMRVRDPS